MVAISVARLTVASWTPSVLRRNRSIRFTQEAHVMPSMGSWISEAAAARVWSVVILLGSIPAG